MAAASFYRQVLGRAWRGAIAFAGWRPRTPVPGVALLAFGFFVHLNREGRREVLEEWSVLVSFTLAPIAVLALAVFLWNLVQAPVRMRAASRCAADAREDEFQQKITDLEGEACGD